LEAQNAIQIAKWAEADQYAGESFQKAAQLLSQAEDYQVRKNAKKSVVMTAREAVQTAEDARLISVKRRDEGRKAAERSAAQARVEEESRKRVQAEDERINAERAKLEAEAARQEALAQQQAAEAETQRARLAADQAAREKRSAENEKTELRARLTQQLNAVLETRDTARGLIVNMSDVLFDTGKYNLRPAAREKLAKIAGIVLAHPDLRLEVEGHTDDRGSETYNQELSEKRALAVRDYLVAQGLAPATIVAKGFGESMPLLGNDTAEGRQRNRRVELVVSGGAIGG
jgi:outer membrane protein OmpA-like peptidoglycan-associated protein